MAAIPIPAAREAAEKDDDTKPEEEEEEEDGEPAGNGVSHRVGAKNKCVPPLYGQRERRFSFPPPRPRAWYASAFSPSLDQSDTPARDGLERSLWCVDPVHCAEDNKKEEEGGKVEVGG